MQNVTKNLFPTLSAMLKQNHVTLDKEEFKTVLHLINGKIQEPVQKLTPLAELVVHIFDQKELTENECYMVSLGDQFALVKNRTQLLQVLLKTNVAHALPKIKVVSFGEAY